MYMDGVGFSSGNRIDLAAFAHFGGIEAIEAAIVRAIVRGEQPVGALEQTGIRITAHRVHRAVGDPAAAFLAVRSADFAEGILNLKATPQALAEWASFVLLTSELYALPDRHADYCDRLLAAIWDLAFGARLDAAVVRLASSIQNRFSNA